MIFVDASALIAIIAGEEDADALADRLDGDPDRRCSALSIWETVAGLCRSYRFGVAEAREHVRHFLDIGEFRYLALGETEAALALDAYERFGRGRHPASLNMGDCFSYAAARSLGATLLYKGDDFAKTDLA